MLLEKKSITYPMVLDYVKSWGEWEVIREIVSNSIDTNTEYTILMDNNNLVIADNGLGLQIKQLLFQAYIKQKDWKRNKFSS